MKLYELSSSHQAIFDMILDEDVDLNVLEDNLQCIEATLEVKVQNGIGLIKSLEAYHDAVEAEEKRLASMRKTAKNRIDWVKNLYKNTMEAMSKDKIQTPIGTMAIQNNPPALVIDNEKSLHAEYITIVPVQYVPNKDKIKADLKAGKEVPGARLVQGRSLRIR